MTPAGAGGANPFGAQFTPQQEEEFQEMARSENFYERFASSIAPSIFGSVGKPYHLLLAIIQLTSQYRH